MLQTILSRCQVIDFIGLSESVIAEALVSRENCEPTVAKKSRIKAKEIITKRCIFYEKKTMNFRLTNGL